MNLKQRATAFAWVGAIGFVMDAGVLALCVHVLGVGPYISRILSFLAAVSFTWFLNRHWTFALRKTRSKRHEYMRYFSVQSLGMLINLMIYALCIESVDLFRQWPVLALAIGSIGAAAFNFAASHRFVFKHKHSH